jgi:hypothetical protein
MTRFKYGGATWTFTYPHVVPDLLGPKEYVEDEKETSDEL